MIIGLVSGLALVMLTACASDSSTDASSSQAATSAASAISQAPSVDAASLGGVTLADLGFQHAPADFRVPTGLELSERVDQENVVTLVVPGTQGSALYEFVRAELSSVGFTLAAVSDDSLIFGAPGWDGAFTMDDQVAGLTLRRLTPSSSSS